MNENLDSAFAVFNTYDWGMDPKVLEPVEHAIAASAKDGAARRDIEARLAAVLKSNASRDAKDMACRMLQKIGTAASVPALATLLADENLSHMARYALERIPNMEAGQALRAALANTNGKTKVGIIASLGVRAEEASVAPLQTLLHDGNAPIAQAAAHALGDVGSLAAAKALFTGPINPDATTAAADALMACAEKALHSGNKTAAKASYSKLAGSSNKIIADAAKRGIQACDR